jgi:hypothetical protein
MVTAACCQPLGRRRQLPAAARSHGSIYSGATPHFFLPEPGLSNKRIRSRLRGIYPCSLDSMLDQKKIVLIRDAYGKSDSPERFNKV